MIAIMTISLRSLEGLPCGLALSESQSMGLFFSNHYLIRKLIPGEFFCGASHTLPSFSSCCCSSSMPSLKTCFAVVMDRIMTSEQASSWADKVISIDNLRFGTLPFDRACTISGEDEKLYS